MRDLGLPDRIRAKAVPVVGVGGWETRGISDGFQPRIALLHHTAGSSLGTIPSLGVLTHGREGLPGPLCQVGQSREADPWDDKAYIVASGKANHAGVGSWQGYDSNYEAHGLEVEHVGTGPVHKARLEVSARIIAAMLEAPGSTRSAGHACQHFEYALPPGRKIDFYNLGPRFTVHTFRQRVAYWIGRTTTVPVGPDGPDFDDSPQEDWFDMATEADLRKVINQQLIPRRVRKDPWSEAAGDPIWITDANRCQWKYRVVFGSPIDAWIRDVLAANGLSPNAIVMEQAVIDGIPEVQAVPTPVLLEFWAATFNPAGPSALHRIVEQGVGLAGA